MSRDSGIGDLFAVDRNMVCALSYSGRGFKKAGTKAKDDTVSR